ncbi:hypothetical protein Tsubulata_007670, partial [Turnera subulata]
IHSLPISQKSPNFIKPYLQIDCLSLPPSLLPLLLFPLPKFHSLPLPKFQSPPPSLFQYLLKLRVPCSHLVRSIVCRQRVSLRETSLQSLVLPSSPSASLTLSMFPRYIISGEERG